jgi:glycerol-3-phosphate cytidylyltransferase-like family protein
MEISYSFGILDLIHAGHIQALAEGKKDSDLHIFGLVKDDAVMEWNGHLVSTYEEREKTLKSIKYVDMVIPQETFDPTNNLKKIHEQYPDAEITLIRGSDWKFLPAEDFLKSINGKIRIIPYYKKLSPEKILEQMKEKTK